MFIISPEGEIVANVTPELVGKAYGALASGDMSQIEQYWAGALRRAVIEGDVETGSVMAGQSVGMVRDEAPAAEILAQLMDEAARALERRSAEEGA